jgi:hypothetical protein
MEATIEYFETGTKTVKYATGDLFFGDALLQDYLGLRMSEGYLLVPSATVITIKMKELDEDLYAVNTESMKRSKMHTLKRLREDLDREVEGGRFHG